MTRRRFVLVCCAFDVVMLCAASRSVADPVQLASAEMGAAGRDSGSSITPAQFIGWRFSIDEPLRVERVGGHLWADPFQEGEIFAALVRLDSITAVPHGAPFTEEEVVASTTFRPNFPSDEYLAPLSATLAAGSYVLVFGTGLFGAEGYGALPNPDDQPDIPPTDLSSFIFWSRPSPEAELEWRQNLASHMRVLVEGQTFPLAGDYDLNGVVDDADYEVWKTSFAATGSQNADGSRNEIVDAADYTVWRDHLGDGASPGAAALAPEPAAAIILVTAIAWIAAPRSQSSRRPERHEHLRSASLRSGIRAAVGS